ncbi:MAG TPA: dTDP-4-dehydrorhamnose 3,5-epimerase [Solirubrobacteraceae bacterium]|jgi:dTDP-4-dehydrorhamnose 3,5-epimerase|nr:dTDP-4-dehydrorhamnose 3,5-epimerase [Solirubrobacteraceae bacterium]
MEIRSTDFAQAKLIVPAVHADDRGFFTEVYRRDALAEAGIDVDFVQDNQSRSSRGVLRGMHLQIGAGVAKLVRCARGQIVDVIVDVRAGSPTYRHWQAFELDDRSQHALFVPAGFAHGFCVVSEVADVCYSQSGYYDPQAERTIAHDDPELAIEWPSGLEYVVSARDAAARTLREQAAELVFGD